MEKILGKFLTVKTFITVFLVVWISLMVREGVTVPEWYLAAAFYPVLQSLFNKDNINVKMVERLNAAQATSNEETESDDESTQNPEEAVG